MHSLHHFSKHVVCCSLKLPLEGKDKYYLRCTFFALIERNIKQQLDDR